ncbi:xanthine dehydrogenase family protein molybdopterin-binding subunit [Desulfogranum japonicum]|uniref:xanthine dehydrogenase family protein molybdopterin-binding subunit n=1 Tax=Desulfogranum japonicum TaxID=231447 RepID=UPI0004234D43|nr:xanthine dehydrogenase family protein molybdopterin-binding subunit [Desulfogranum japonicum]
MHTVSRSVVRDDAMDKASGTSCYIADITLPGMLSMAFKTSTAQHARICSISIPRLPEGYVTVDGRDFKGQNRATIVAEDWPFFAEKEVLYFGQPLLAIVGPDQITCERLCAGIEVKYEMLESVSSIEDARECFNDFTVIKGDPAKAFLEATDVFERFYQTGLQEHAYLEPQGMLAIVENGIVTVRGAMQCPFNIHTNLTKALALNPDQVRVIQSTTGGGFGGKEDFPSILAGQVAVAAVKTKTGRPVKVVLDRRLDMLLTPKRHPSRITIRTAIGKSGRITAMDIDCQLDAGAYETLSRVVLERAMFICTGAYTIANVKVRGRTMKTNHVPSGAFRGFGGPQAHFAAEMNMSFLADKLGLPPLALKQQYLTRQGDLSITSGTYRYPTLFEAMLARVEEASGYSEKWQKYARGVVSSCKRGIGISFAAHGGAFTGNGEQELIKSLVRLSAEYADLTSTIPYMVRIMASSVDMGQGTTMALKKIVAQTMELPVEHVLFTPPDTARVPDSGPTVASRTVMIVGNLLQKAAVELRTILDSGQLPTKEEPLIVEQRYMHPEELTWDEPSFYGDAYPAYSWSVNVVEVEIDPITSAIKIIGSWAAYDVGVPIDNAMLQGQMQGGVAQALGYATLEQMQMIDGKPAQHSLTDYIIPTIYDVPELECFFVKNPYKHGPFGAKGAGELPHIGPAPALAEAVSQATGKLITKIPITPEQLVTKR